MLKLMGVSTSGLRGTAAALGVVARGKLRNAPSEAVPVPMRELGGENIFVRPGTTDLINAASYYHHGVHLPPPEVGNLNRIVELGTNSGAALTALAARYPDAALLGIEPDAGNLAIAQQNVERFGARCRIVAGAVWTSNAALVFDESRRREAGEHGLVVREAEAHDLDAETVEALTIDELLHRNLEPDEPVDYMHVTIEGAEPAVFAAGGEWPRRVQSLRTEVHPYFGFGISDCVTLLEKLGYRAWAAPHPADKWVMAVRPSP